MTCPTHVAIILDGNGRWANARGLPRVAGHQRGAERVREIVRAAGNAGVEYLTLFTLSTDNKKRPVDEVRALYALLEDFAESEREELMSQGARVQVVGDVPSLPASCQAAIRGLEAATAHGKRLLLRLAVAYGARDDIAQATRKLARMAAAGELDPESITEEAIRAQMWTAGAPSPDLVIRTGGDRRLSDFLLLEAAYSELYFTDTAWPDFGPNELVTALADFGRRERRFGLIAVPSVAKALSATG